MTVSSLNPFPDYAVTRLAPGEGTEVVTVITPAIAKGRELASQYIAGVGNRLTAGQTNAALCAVRGDYGTGKTHLLNDVASQLEHMGASSILRATCIETDPLSWFRTKVGQQLEKLPLYETALELYGLAGRTVAGRTELTASAADVLEEDPTRIRELIRANHISIDEVSREFEKQLGIICKDYDLMVLRVLSRLVSSETGGPAIKWLCGATLIPRDAELLGVPPAIDAADQASSVIGAIASMHKAVARPFVVLVDELEHFTRYDEAGESWGNVTWLKRLLEQLGSAGSLALVAGHWDAWHTTKDYLDRFPQYAPIDLVKLEPAEVADIVETLLGGLPPGFEDMHAKAIASVTGGNMRRVMSLCNLLFRQTDGFTSQLTERVIHEAWTSVAQRIPQQQALEEIVALLEPRGFDVALDTTFHALPFDLVAQRDDGRAIVVQAKHASTQDHHYSAARKFVDKLAKVAASAPRAIGMFLASGSIDDELLRILRGSGISNLRWFDLTSRDVMERIGSEIETIDGQTRSGALGNARTGPRRSPSSRGSAAVSATDQGEAEAPKLEARNADLERRLHELDVRRQQETQALRERLEKLALELQSPRGMSVREDARIRPERERAQFEALLEKPSLNKKLRLLGSSLILGGGCVALGVFLALARELTRDVIYPSGIAVVTGIAMLFMGIFSAAFGIWTIWRRYSQVADYFEFSSEAIRDLYLRDVPIRDLSRVNTILRQAIRRYGPRYARRGVLQDLTHGAESPEIRAYFDAFPGR